MEGEGDFRENLPMQLRSAACFFPTCFRLIAAELLRLAAADRERLEVLHSCFA